MLQVAGAMLLVVGGTTAVLNGLQPGGWLERAGSWISGLFQGGESRGAAPAASRSPTPSRQAHAPQSADVTVTPPHNLPDARTSDQAAARAAKLR